MCDEETKLKVNNLERRTLRSVVCLPVAPFMLFVRLTRCKHNQSWEKRVHLRFALAHVTFSIACFSTIHPQPTRPAGVQICLCVLKCDGNLLWWCWEILDLSCTCLYEKELAADWQILHIGSVCWSFPQQLRIGLWIFWLNQYYFISQRIYATLGN